MVTKGSIPYPNTRSFLFVLKSHTFRGNRPRNFPQLDLYTLPNLRVLFENGKIYNEGVVIRRGCMKIIRRRPDGGWLVHSALLYKHVKSDQRSLLCDGKSKFRVMYMS